MNLTTKAVITLIIAAWCVAMVLATTAFLGGCDDDAGMYPCEKCVQFVPIPVPVPVPPAARPDAGVVPELPLDGGQDATISDGGSTENLDSGVQDGGHEDVDDLCVQGIGRCIRDCVHRGYRGKCCVAHCKSAREALCGGEG